MALVKTVLEDALLTAFKEQMAKTSNPEDAFRALAKSMATAIDAYIKSATVVYSAGLVAPPGGGPVTGVLTHTIS